MYLQNTNIHNFVVQSIHVLIMVAMVAMNGYPLPALAFAQEITPHSGYFPYTTLFEVTATAYSSTPDQTDASPFITASGSHVREGIIAANFLPMGTRVRIGDKMYDVEDRKHERFNNTRTIDIWMSSREKAVQFGTKKLILEVIEVPKG